MNSVEINNSIRLANSLNASTSQFQCSVFSFEMKTLLYQVALLFMVITGLLAGNYFHSQSDFARFHFDVD